MPVLNSEIRGIFEKYADLLEIQEANQFRVRAYRNAAQSIGNLSRNIRDMVNEDKNLTDIDGIGKDLAAKIKEIVRTGTMQELEDLENELSADLVKMLNLPGLGPKRVKSLYDKLDVSNITELKKAAEENKIRTISGFGEKTEEKILKGMKEREKEGVNERFLLSVADEVTIPFKKYLSDVSGVKDLTIAGSYRRRKETVGDLDILITCDDRAKIMDAFTDYEDVEKIVSKGDTTSTIILNSGFQVDLRVVDEESYGSALLYFTGSKDHNVALRRLAQAKDWKVNEYGIFNEDEEKLAGKTEEEMYQKLGMPYIQPELRENNGEIKAAQDDQLPELITEADLQGDLQMHTDATDGKNTLEEMVEAARDKGYQYIAITDHSKRVSMAGGLDEEDIIKQIEKINKIDEQYDDIKILKSVEVDILKDGSLDLADDILKKLDLTICSVHYNRNLDRDEQTRRVLTAMDNPYFDILAHPTGRLIGKRQEMELDLEKIMEKAKDKNCYLEINAHPRRLDLSDKYIRLARQMGVKLVISTDAHSLGELDNIGFGVDQARRGWLEKEDVINTRTFAELKKLVKRD